MKMHEITQLTESSLLLDKLKKFAKTHYSDAEDETEALLTLFARSLQHAEEDDHRQDKEIALLKQEINKIKRSSSNPVQNPEPNSI